MKIMATDYKKIRRRERLKKNLKYKSHLIFLANNCNYYPFPVVAMDKDKNYAWASKWISDLDDGSTTISYYKRLYRSNHRGSRYQIYKRYANRVVRRHKGEIHKGSNYKKCFDYWWTVD